MNIETVIAIITAGIAFITSVASFTYNLLQNRKDRIQKVILDNRIKYMDEIREGFSAFIPQTNPETVQLVRNNRDLAATAFEKLATGYGKIKTYIKPFYAIDNELLLAMDALYRRILIALNDPADDLADIKELRTDFADKYLKYDWAYWKYIQRQKDGNYMNSDNAFDNVYADFVKNLEKFPD